VVKNVIFANKIINLIKSFTWGKKWIESIMEKEHYYKSAIKYGDYFLNVTNNTDFIIVINQKEIDTISKLTNNNVLLYLPGDNN